MVAEYNSANALTKRYVHGDQVDEPWVQYETAAVGSGNWRYIHADHQGSVIAYSTSAGALSGSALSYDTYGIPKSTNAGRFGYTGQAWLKELGLFHYKARVYHPRLGRFLQTDPIFYADQMNMYAYVGNDPVNKIDPSGMAQCDKSLSSEQCEKGLNDSDNARDNATQSAGRLREVAGNMKNGKLSDADKKTLGVVAQYGSKFTSAKGLERLAKGLDKAANKIGVRGEGVVLTKGDDARKTKDGDPSAAYVNRSFFGTAENSINLTSGYFGMSQLGREQTMLHEAAHVAGFWGDTYNADILNLGAWRFGRNADSYACIPYPAQCGL